MLRRIRNRRTRAPRSYAPLHPEAYRFDTANLTEAARSPARSGEAPPSDSPAPGILSVELFTPEFCAKLDAEIAHRESWQAQQGAPLPAANDMHDYGVPLGDLGFAPLLRTLTETIVEPLAAEHFPELRGPGGFDHEHGFVVDYATDRDLDLGFHVDDSEVTVNLCLRSDATGADLLFRGRRCFSHRQTNCREEERVSIRHRPGVAIVHAGWHRHEVSLLERGRRRNLISWCQSSTYREQDAAAGYGCRPWCGHEPGSPGGH